jgi:hypothetical protein
VREGAERVRAVLGEAEGVLRRLVGARVMVVGVPAGPAFAVVEPARGGVVGSVVPYRVAGMAASVLAPG